MRLQYLTDFNSDFFNCYFGHGFILAARYGSLQRFHYVFAKLASNMKRSIAEPNQVPELLARVSIACQHWPYLLGKGKEMALLISELKMDWDNAEAACDSLLGDQNIYCAPRGKCNEGPFFANMDAIYWTIRLNYALCAPDGAVPHEDVLRSLAQLTPELLSEYFLCSPDMGGGSNAFVLQLGFSPHLVAALVSEKFGQLDQALAYVAVIHDVDANRGGDHKMSSHITGNVVKGRVLQQRGQTAEAAAAFEAAVAQAEEVQLPLLAMFALKDLKLHVLDGMGHAEHASRCLGVVLRKMKDSAEMFTPLLDGLDASELMALPPPDAECRVVYPQSLSGDDSSGELRTELSSMKLSALRKRAKADGVDEDSMETASDGENEQEALIVLIISHQKLPPAKEQLKVLREELGSLRPSALRKRANTSGVSEAAMEDAADGKDEKGELIELLVAVPEPVQVHAVATDRPHFGSANATQDQPAPLATDTKHVMLSYQWDHQAQVTRVYDTLTRLGVKCWMDIRSGMSSDIYESMAEGVSNASVVVCFMSQKCKYRSNLNHILVTRDVSDRLLVITDQASVNCKLELKYAQQCGVEIVPVVMEGPHWRASGWLGIITAGSLWTWLSDESAFDDNVRQLHGQIQQIVGATPDIEEASDEAVASPTEAKEELARLREDLDAKAESQATPVLADPSLPATILAGVPKLPPKFQTTEQIEELTRLVLSTDASDMSMSRVGFWGMGGIGKTVTGAAIVRNEDVRLHFHAIIWLPLGQTPVISKLQNLCHMQCAGKELSSELSSEEKKEALQQATKGKRVLLCLDDLWEEEHELELNFVDVNAGSKVLISTRMKGLLDGGHQVEVGLPSPSDSARMLLRAADADSASAQPAGVSEIVDLCGRLPLALGIAGRLAASLDLVGTQDWSDMIGVLKEELRDSHSGGAEEGMIRASLRGLKGSKEEQANVKSLLLLFGLVPEDTHCPLDVLLLMFKATNAGSAATIMHIRKWLRVLINRSLVLGTIDRPSVHDLVLDFAVGQYSTDDLRLNHRQIVEAFREARPEDVYGRRMYEKTQKENPMAAYVCNEISYHIANGWESDMERDELATQEWLCDVPQDVLVVAAGCNLGAEKLSSLASAAEGAQDWWLAARYFHLVRLVMFERGGMSPAMNDPIESCLAALDHVRDGDSSRVPVELREQEQEQVHFSAVVSCAQLLNNPVMAARADEFELVLNTTTATRNIATVAGVRWFSTFMRPFLDHWVKELFKIASMMRDAAEQSESVQIVIARANYPQNVNCLLLHPDFEWEMLLGRDGEAFRDAMSKYEFNLHHDYLMDNFNGDWLCTCCGVWPYTQHLGDIDVSLQMLDKQLESMKKSVKRYEEGVFAERVGLMFGVPAWLFTIATMEFPRADEVARLADAHGFSWKTADATADLDAAAVPWVRERGDTTVNAGAICTAEQISWCGKLCYFLNSTRPDVSEEEVMAALPSVEEVWVQGVTYDNGPAGMRNSTHEANGSVDTYVCLALVCEKCGQHARGLSYADAGLDPRTKGGTTAPTNSTHLHRVRGRLLVALGRTADAAAAFEASAESASKYGLFMLEVLALRDFKLSILDLMGQGEHASRRLGQALRRLRNPDSLSQLLKGLDAKQLMALAAPNPTHRISFGPAANADEPGGVRVQASSASNPTATPPEGIPPGEPEVAALRQELQAMRLMPLHARAAAEGAGVDPESLEDAMESANPKSVLVRLLLEAAASAAANRMSAESDAVLRAELHGMRVMKLHARALDEGLDGARVEDAMESDNPKDTLVELLLLRRVE